MYDAIDLVYQPARVSVSNNCLGQVDFIEAGAGPLVVLVHSSMAGAHQWSALSSDLAHRYHVRAINLFGYGRTPAWSEAEPPSLGDYAELVARAVPSTANGIRLVGHSFGAAVAMQAAAHQLNGRVKDLVLIEPSLFYLLDSHDHREAFREIAALAKYTRRCLSNDAAEAAAERFVNYWCGHGTWAASSPARQFSFVRLVGLLPHEWNAVLGGTMTPAEWSAALPQHTLVMSSARTTRPSRELVDVLLDVCLDWEFAMTWVGGHMAPLTHPQLVNPIIRSFLA
jgi:pimeloyl-ACP methyl ester carboxylesterase